jgi:CRP-like cAMP-binding protein
MRKRGEALETLINFGPSWLAVPLARLLEPEAFDPVLARPLTQTDLEELAKHPDKWVRETAEAAVHGLDDHMKELIALKEVPLFSALTLDQLASVDRLMVTRHYSKGETVFRRGDVGAELYVVVDGEIRVHLDHAGREVTLARHRSGGVLGEMSVFDEQPRSAGAQAMADTTVRVLKRDRLEAVVHEHPEVLLEFIKSLSQRIREMDARLEAATPEEIAPAATRSLRLSADLDLLAGGLESLGADLQVDARVVNRLQRGLQRQVAVLQQLELLVELLERLLVGEVRLAQGSTSSTRAPIWPAPRRILTRRSTRASLAERSTDPVSASCVML